MDYIKYAILAGLAVVTYLLLLAWQDDYVVTDTRDNPAAVAQTASNGQTTTNGDVPAATTNVDLPTPPVDNSDIPVAPSSAPTGVSSVGSTESLITVQTDVLNVTIDRVGGDIVFASLPQHATRLDSPDEPFVLLENSNSRTYVAQSGLIGADGIDGAAQRPVFDSAADHFQLTPGQDQLTVDLVYTDSKGVEIVKRFTFRRGDHLIDINFDINNSTDGPWRANIFGQIKRNDFPDPTRGNSLGMRSFLGFATTSPDDNYAKIPFDDIASGRAGHEMEGGWVAMSQHYFISVFVPSVETRNTYSFRRNNAGEYIGGFTTNEFVVPPGSRAGQQISFYAGPKDQYRLRDIAPWLDRTIDYGWLWFIASPIYWLLTKINDVVGNYGWSILILTVIVKAIFFKLSATSYRSMANMRRVMPKMNQLKERYGDDKVKLQKATMELYQKEKINPFGGCLPMLVQMPVFIALYWVLLEGVELRHAPWILWIKDLSVMDPYFVLPLLMGASMYVQFMLNPTPQDPTQAKIMKFMPIAMTLFFLWFPAGLVLYWLANNVLGIAQQWYITRKLEAEFAAKEASRS